MGSALGERVRRAEEEREAGRRDRGRRAAARLRRGRRWGAWNGDSVGALEGGDGLLAVHQALDGLPGILQG